MVDKITKITVHCPECGAKMHRMGKAWSGRKQVQRYRCPKCGRTATENAALSADRGNNSERGEK